MYDVLNEVTEELTAPGQPFSLSETEVRGQMLRVWSSAPPTLRDFWLATARHADKDYLVYGDERLTYSQAHEQVARVANWLCANGISHGDRVAIAMRNYPEWLLSYWAIASVGAVSVGMNAWWVAEELEYALRDSQSKLLIADRERLARFQEIRANFPALPVVGVRTEDMPGWARTWDTLLEKSPVMPEATIDPDDDACIFYTSGTTGRPKGAQLTHRGCTNNVFSVLFSNLSQLTAAARIKGGKSGVEVREKRQPSTIIAAPLFHVTTNNGTAHVNTWLGGKLVHMYKWDAGEALRIIEEEQVTSFSSVPMMTREMINHPDFEKRDTSSVSMFGGGGAPVQPDMVDKVRERGRGAAAAQGYGLTEVCGLASSGLGIFLQSKPGSAGRVVPVFEVKAIDKSGNPLPVGEAGEICLRGSQVIKGYLNQPEATAETIVDGWLHTGDIGYVDGDGFLYLVDRAKDMVLRGGENVYCSEVESVLYRFPGVAECAVFSVPDERLGEEVGAAIVAHSGAELSADEIKAFCVEHLAKYKIPRYVWILTSPLPQNATGKVVKRELQATLLLDDAL